MWNWRKGIPKKSDPWVRNRSWKQPEQGRHGKVTWLSLSTLGQHLKQGLPTLDPEMTTSCSLCKAEKTQNIKKWAIWKLQRGKCQFNDKSGTVLLPTWQATSCPIPSSSVQMVTKQALEKLTLVKYCSPIPASQGLFTCCSWVSYPTSGCSVHELWGHPGSSCELWVILILCKESWGPVVPLLQAQRWPSVRHCPILAPNASLGKWEELN